MSDPELPSVHELQFRRAEPVANQESSSAATCVACKQPIVGQHYQVQGQVICATCAERIRAGQQAAKPVPLLRAVIYGAGAALAGCLLYAIVLAMGVQIGIVALAVGWMVGKAIRAGAYGVGGRPQQILAVALTYFAISTSILPADVFIGVRLGRAARKQAASQQLPQAPPKLSPGKAVAGILILAAISPFLELFGGSPVGGLLSLFILFIGLQRAWALTARHDILVTGPYT